MDSDYDRKFEDMKKYIPFLESMIKRLESTSNSSANPRQAQLDKIRSLRDLLLDKKKRMKMENLLKCEQVLVNLYAKVEQRDTLPGINKASDPLFPSASTQDVKSPRSKNNTAVTKTIVDVDDPDTLPEIARACETEVVCTPGSKEPALFQRRPNKKSISPSRPSSLQHTEKKSPQKSMAKRNYTRVLVSPEPSTKRWPSTEGTASDVTLFTRRSPRKHSPSHLKKEKKKSSKQNKSLPKDLNITLNVPEESLNSLNTGDILSRIIKCPDNDVDIATLRDLRQQILGELKQTGASDDISDLILKSYKNKKKTSKKKHEVEEGELSDSESEAIASVYGSLVVVDKDKSNTGQTKIAEKEKQPRKIQICLVINSDKENDSTDQIKEKLQVTDASDFEMFNDIGQTKTEETPKTKDKEQKTDNNKVNEKIVSLPKTQDVITIDDDDVIKKDIRKTIESEFKSSDSSLIDISSPEEDMESCEPEKKGDSENTAPAGFRANFYKPLSEQEEVVKTTTQLESCTDNSKQITTKSDSLNKVGPKEKTLELEEKGETSSSNKSNPNQNQVVNSGKIDSLNVKDSDNVKKSTEETVEIPLLNLEPTVPAPPKKDNVSEIEILQALKNEILSESIAIPGGEITPALHQPKVTKVASANEVAKKRISIEKYKEKSVPTKKTSSLFINEPGYSRYIDQSKKHSLKLTEEELERFNFPSKLALHDSSDEEEENKVESTYTLEDIYADLAPKSPDTTEKTGTEKTAPIIIPVDPVKPVTVSSKTDVDMRTIIPIISPNAHQSVSPTVLSPSGIKNVSDPINDKKLEPKRPPLVDPRVRRELTKSVNKESPNPRATNPERTPRQIGTFPNMTPNLAPNMTPNSRPFEMTPSHQSIDADDNNSRKHVYAPFPTFDSRWEPNSELTKENRNNRWEPWMDSEIADGNQSRKREDRNRRSGSVRDNAPDFQISRYDAEVKQKSSRSNRYSQDQGDDYLLNRIDCPRTPVHPFGRLDCPPTPTPSFGRLDVGINPFIMADCPPTPGHPFGMSDFSMTPSHPFGLTDAPMTPSHPFGRNDALMTPSHPFVRTDAPMTPSHPFGRSDGPMTPSHPFGRSDVPMTPSHPFGRIDAPMTPSHPFGRTDAPMTPSHPFGRSDALMAPSHPFGRSETGMAPMTPSHPFGRSDYTQNQQILGPRKDPRLNRSSDYDSSKRKRDDNRDRDYKDRRKSENRSFNNDSFYGREQSAGRNDRNLFEHRNNRDQTPGREQSRGRSVTRDCVPENVYTRSGDRPKDYRDVDTSNYSEVEQRRGGYQRAHSVSRSRPEERFCRSSSRAPSVERSFEKVNERTLSVKPQSGRSFTIDTSVNTTFQEFLKGKGLQVFDHSFDSRRQRASSVGRSLTREPSVGRNFREGSVGRTLPKPLRPFDEDTSGYKTMVNFVRARSMGRDLTDKPERSFKDIKAEFESYRTNSKPKQIKPDRSSKGKQSNQGHRKKNLYELQHNKIADSVTSSVKKTTYSPRKNYRDPRMRRDNYDNKNKYRHENQTKNYGIVYSHDNISKGTILGSGYGVKNYKIPKIKRPVEEQVVKDSKINEKKSNLTEKEKNIPVKKEKVNKKGIEVDSKIKLNTKIEKDKNFRNDEDKKQNIGSKPKQARKTKVSRSSEKTEPETIVPEETTVRTRRTKKAVIDSDSDSETAAKNKDIVKNDVSKSYNKIDCSKTNLTTNDEEDKDILDTSFGMDEIFPENITLDPVMANINALIADLDNDIDTTKTEDLNTDFRDIAFNSLLESINTSGENKQITSEQSLNDLSHLIDTNSQNISGTVNEENNKKTVDSELNDLSITNDKSLARELPNNDENDKKITDVVSNEDTVSTTGTDKEPLQKLEIVNDDCHSTPDSTINSNEVVHNHTRDEEGLPDSTNEKNYMQSDVTSTHDQSESSEKNTSKETEPISSIGNLLSILKDKSKTKKLLSLLGDQSEENLKIKKKLEKLLSESDDEDTNDGMKDDIAEKGEEIEPVNDVGNKGNTSDNKFEKNIPKDETQHQDILITETQDISVDETQALKEADESLTVNDDTKELSSETLTTTLDNKEQEKVALDNKEQEVDDKQSPNLSKPRKVTPKKTKKGKSKQGKKVATSEERRVTRSGVANSQTEKPKKASRELRQLQESIKEMFMSDGDILNATGIRMCRLAKLAEDKSINRPEDDNGSTAEPKPVVVLEKFTEKESLEDAPKIRKKPGPKPKSKIPVTDTSIKPESVLKEVKTSVTSKYKPGPKSKTKVTQDESDPYSFDDSVSEATTGQTSVHTSSDSDDDSLASAKSFGSSEVLAEIKRKPKRKRRSGWQSGIIKSSKRRKKSESKQTDSSLDDCPTIPQKPTNIPDMNCFTDKTYCFLKNTSTYYCRLCDYNGTDIVKHYKNDHPHSEIPLSRMSPAVAREAIDECEDIHFQAISKMTTEKYVCRFCFDEFSNKKAILEEFFWHIVSMHTGEYKRLCSECINVNRCPFNLDIPPPPKDVKGQLIGYICGKCNFTQISLENLKIHVIVRHNDEQTAVYTINLAAIGKKTMKALLKRCQVLEQPRVLRSLRSNPNTTQTGNHSDHSEAFEDDHSDTDLKDTFIDETDSLPKGSVQTKLEFESDDNMNDAENNDSSTVKVERNDNENQEVDEHPSDTQVHQPASTDILDYPHFKISYKDSGTKEYVCCINGKDNHYKTSLLISMKKHVQIKHSEIWDGYCFVCKVIVMPQGQHLFKECLHHLLDKHMDNLPVLEQKENYDISPTTADQTKIPDVDTAVTERSDSPKTYINVRPLSDLLSKKLSDDSSVALPKIQSVISLGAVSDEVSPSSPSCSSQTETVQEEATVSFKTPILPLKPAPVSEETFKYEEVQAEVMSKKHRVIVDAMISHEKLIQIYKCSGRFCSFTTDSADAAVTHASTHQRIGGENSLICAYCDFDCKGNAIDLVMHVFKAHGRCKFVCGHCFYRACTSQLVETHVSRIHGETASQVILEATNVTPVDEDSSLNVLPRETAVQHYVCNSSDGMCKFKTYMPGKFIDHLSKHGALNYTCYICLEVLRNPNELLYHMKNHGMMLYQCTWCIDGGDNETEFMAHSSARHPFKEPQAYLRITTNNQKDGASKTMILPLVKLNNKSNIPTKLVTPNANVEDPVKEAERAIDLEKIITSMPLLATETTKKPEIPPKLVTTCELPQVPASTDQALEPEIALDPNILTSPPHLEQHDEPTVAILTHVIKKEPLTETPTMDASTSHVICLDSDEEDSRDSSDSRAKVIDLSEDDPSSISNSALPKPQLTKFLPLELFKCQNCNVTFKNLSGFKRHIVFCFSNMHTYRCAHCPLATKDINSLCLHYNDDHSHQVGQIKLPHVCGICARTDKSKWVITYHLKKDHGATSVLTTAKFEANKVVGYVHTSAGAKQKQPSKRKSSFNSTVDTSPKRTRYGPQDLDKLPQKPILDDLTYCSECEFSTKVRLNLVRHFQQHAEALTVPQTAPVNPVPHLETNERHFDKMVNLASSSLETIRSDKQPPAVTLHMPAEAASRYPKYVPDRQRHTCGAKDCSYISVDEAMLKCHWETLHAGSNDFHCVHCPPYQHLDTSKPLTASRIIAHLKMHDVRLYACSSCTYYHYKKQVLDKHLAENHKGTGEVIVVREEFTNQSPVSLPQPSNAAPTMDLKPWKCGLCEFKSMLRPEVVEHCSKVHNTKMQFKCPVCPFRTSTLENVTKHHSKSHPGNTEEVFYYYYREGSVPDEADGTPRWLKQRQKMGNPEPEVKTETPDTSQTNPTPLPPILPSPVQVDLDIVKKEVVDSEFGESMHDLCKHFGETCDPNGLKYKCPLCKFVMEDSKDAMQSHLYEELQYRKWACSICSYKAFHKTGLHEHVVTEHGKMRLVEPIELPADMRVERWVAYVLDHQSAAIESNKTNLARQKIQVEKPSLAPTSTPAKDVEKLSPTNLPSKKSDEKETDNAVQAFGPLGSPNNTHFCCPKCDFRTADEGTMKDHLETELNKIRWRCSGCCEHSQNYHEAQLHAKTCKSSRPGHASRPVEAVRDPSTRAAWVAAVISTQKLGMNQAPAIIQTSPTSVDDSAQTKPDNSLLVIRYEEEVQTPEEQMLNKRKRPTTAVSSPDSDDERLIIDEESRKKLKKCPYCDYSSKYQQPLDFHVLRHWNLKPYTCSYCELNFSKYYNVSNHTQQAHPGMPERYVRTRIPDTPPFILELSKKGRWSTCNDDTSKSKEEVEKEDGPLLVCLVCEKCIAESDTEEHKHEKPTYFARKGDVVVKCCVCLSLLPNMNCLKDHQIQTHPNIPINYAYFKVNPEIIVCGYCSQHFRNMRDLKTHHNVLHATLQLKYKRKVLTSHHVVYENEGGESSKITMSESVNLQAPIGRKVARKSTTKLPSHTVARKSTTKLPFYYYPEPEPEREYSFYGTKPTPLEELENVSTLMPFCNTTMSFTMKKLSEIIKIDPVVLVKDCKK